MSDAETRAALYEAVEALKEVMAWIKNWDPDFVEDDEWDDTKARVDKVLS